MGKVAQITVRRSQERGRTRSDWLDSHHTFSFGEYRDPAHVHFGPLRVINEDFIAPGGGFGLHPHRDMEIITWVLQGALQHRDSLGNGSVIRPGECQVMTAGTGIEHSEANPSHDEPVHLLQIWILPEQRHLAPRYGQRFFEEASRWNQWRLIASGDEQADVLRIHQDASVHTTLLESGRTLTYAPAPARRLWLQVARGRIRAEDHELAAGDALAITNAPPLHLEALEPAELLLFDLA